MEDPGSSASAPSRIMPRLAGRHDSTRPDRRSPSKVEGNDGAPWRNGSRPAGTSSVSRPLQQCSATFAAVRPARSASEGNQRSDREKACLPPASDRLQAARRPCSNRHQRQRQKPTASPSSRAGRPWARSRLRFGPACASRIRSRRFRHRDASRTREPVMRKATSLAPSRRAHDLGLGADRCDFVYEGAEDPRASRCGAVPRVTLGAPPMIFDAYRRPHERALRGARRRISPDSEPSGFNSDRQRAPWTDRAWRLPRERRGIAADRCRVP